MSFTDSQQKCTTSGEPVEKTIAEQTSKIGQHTSYVILCPEERAKGFVRPYRDGYRHVGRQTGEHAEHVGGCNTVTKMGRALSETYARDPKFYSATFCCKCNAHFPVSEFVWTDDGQAVGS